MHYALRFLVMQRFRKTQYSNQLIMHFLDPISNEVVNP